MAGLALAVDILAKDRASGTLKKVGDQAGKTGKKFDGMKSAAAGFAGGALASGLISFGKSSAEAFKESEQSAAALEQAFAKFPRISDRTAESFGKVNEALARKTKFDDDALASGQATLAQFNLTGKQIEQVTPLLADYASRTGQDLPAAAKALGMAFAGNTRALKQVGINYKSTGDAGKDFTNIQALLNAKVGGFAEKEGKTAAGQAAILQNQFGEVQEQVGAKLVPALTKLANKLLTVIDFVQRNSTAVTILAGTIGTAVGTFLAISKAIAAFNAVAVAMGSSVTIAMGPVGLIIVAIAAFAAGLVIAYKKSETFRKVVDSVFNGIKTVVGSVIRFVVDKVLGWYDLLITGAAKAFGWVPGIGPKLKEAAEKFGQFRDKVNASLSGIQDKDITIRMRTVAAGDAAIADEKAFRRNPTAAPAKTFNTGGRTAGNIVVQPNYDGRKVTSAVSDTQQQRTVRGYVGPS